MNKRIINIAFSGMIMCCLLSSFPASAQDIIEIDALFEYPVAPDELPTMAEKSNYVIEHFWDKLDFKSKKALDQNALSHAFKVYSTALRFAERDKALQVNQKLVNNLSKNPILLLQFMIAAEENIYGPRAEVWIDEVYTQFLEAVVGNKKIQEKKRNRYSQQLSALVSSEVGQRAPRFSFTTLKGDKATYFPMSTPTVIIFGDPSNADWRLARLRLESDINFLQALEKGKLNVLFILPKEIDNWKDYFSNYSGKWALGISEDVDRIYDLRKNPAIFVINSDGKIIEKNSSLQESIQLALQNVK